MKLKLTLLQVVRFIQPIAMFGRSGPYAVTHVYPDGSVTLARSAPVLRKGERG